MKHTHKFNGPLPPQDEMIAIDEHGEAPNERTVLDTKGNVVEVTERIGPDGNKYQTYSRTGEKVMDLIALSGVTPKSREVTHDFGARIFDMPQEHKQVTGLGRGPVGRLSGPSYKGTDETPPPPVVNGAVIEEPKVA